MEDGGVGQWNITGSGVYDVDLLKPLFDDAVKVHAERLAAATEQWCRDAIAQGEGCRVWRSDAVQEPWPSTTITYQFAILKPGEGPSGSGWVFGPWPASNALPT